MKELTLFTKDYDSESLADMLRGVSENLHHEDIKTDEYGFDKGVYTVTITYKEDL